MAFLRLIYDKLLSSFASNVNVRPCIVAACVAELTRLGKRVVLIGELRVGICRHRALLFKYLADLLGLRCRVARGEYRYGRGADDVDGHAWNVVVVGKAR